jgi:hypothetical protein
VATEHLLILCLLGWIPISALGSLIKTMRAGGGKGGKVNNKQLDAMQAELDQLRTEMEQLRSTSTGFDLSFDKRLSEIELQARLAKLKDASAAQSINQTHQH